MFCTVTSGEVNGQIYWVYNADTQQFHHLSHFRTHRSGVGIGKISEQGGIRSKIVFQDEAEGTHRIYEYTWKNDDEYDMIVPAV